MCWTLNHQNIIEMAQGHISLSVPLWKGVCGMSGWRRRWRLHAFSGVVVWRCVGDILGEWKPLRRWHPWVPLPLCGRHIPQHCLPERKSGSSRTSDDGVQDVTPFLKALLLMFVSATTSPSDVSFASWRLVCEWRWGFAAWSRSCCVRGCGSATMTWGETSPLWTGFWFGGWAIVGDKAEELAYWWRIEAASRGVCEAWQRRCSEGFLLLYRCLDVGVVEFLCPYAVRLGESKLLGTCVWAQQRWLWMGFVCGASVI
jgi:hypothetical protein